MGVLGRLARDQTRMIEASDYVRAARARGLGTATVFLNYTLRNTMVPLLAAFGNQLPLFLTSAFIVEIVFSVPGIGSLLLKSVLERDLPTLEGIVLVTSGFSIATSLVLEFLYPIADPRIRQPRAR
jgi:peptide/nickel transport system permease protein